MGIIHKIEEKVHKYTDEVKLRELLEDANRELLIAHKEKQYLVKMHLKILIRVIKLKLDTFCFSNKQK